MTDKQVDYLGGGKKTKVKRVIKRSGRVILKPKIISSREKNTSLIANHIVEATNKGKPIKRNLFARIYNYISKKWGKLTNDIFGM
jgi:hypothetical protein|tara:strand:- start:464 stop:718 length:255 start_codon:yes stop_codon:yes gene_type:complete